MKSDYEAFTVIRGGLVVRPLKQLCNCTVKQFTAIFWRGTRASSLLPVQETMSQEDTIVNNLELTQLINLFVFGNLIVQSVQIQYSI